MPSRRSHSKSRNGCVQCKRARIKCDQSSPSCSKCRKSNKTCLYTSMPSELSRPQLPPPTPISPSSSITPPALHSNPPSLTPAFESADLELMHHYSTSTYLTLAGPDPRVQEAWQVQVPKEAYSHAYLMHSLLALAALHRNSLAEADEQRHSHETALRHYNHALAASKPALSNVDADNCTSLFVLSAVIALVALALPLHVPGRQMDDPVAELLQISTLVRGSKSIVHVEFDLIKAGPLAALLPDGFLAHECDLPSDTRTALALLQRHVDARPSNDSAAYKDTIKLLESCFRNTVPDPEDRVVVLSWLAMVPDAYMSLLNARAPIAQVCLVYFAVLLHGLRKVWWCGDWGRRLVGWVEREAEREWQDQEQDLLAWPKKKMGL